MDNRTRTRANTVWLLGLTALVAVGLEVFTMAQPMSEPLPVESPRVNLAVAAEPSTSYVSGHETLGAIQDDFAPRTSGDRDHGVYGNWPRQGEQWVQYTWPRPITTDGVGVYWFEDRQGIRLPASARLACLDGERWRDIDVAVGTEGDTENVARFEPVTTEALRLYFVGRDAFSTGIVEWRVFDEGSSPAFAPKVDAGGDRVVVIGDRTHLRAQTRGTGQQGVTGAWSKVDGPGEVAFSAADSTVAAATFTEPGGHVLRYTASAGEHASHDDVKVTVRPPLAVSGLRPVATRRYTLDSAFWEPRLRNTIINWIPHVVAKCEEADLKEGGINNLLDAAAKLRGEPHEYHRGYPFSNAWVLNTLESMCVAQMLDPKGDEQLAEAQQKLREKIDEWVPIVLAAQEPDGYFQTRYTLGRRENENPQRFSAGLRRDHEGYVAGYFLDAAVAHYRMTGGADRRMYHAAKKLADCWDAAIGPEPGKQPWWDEHEGMELSLFRFARLVDEVEGDNAGQTYRDLSKFLMDCRGVHGTGATYDQAHVPVTQQYEAVGHAVRAVYLYTGMAEAARYYDDAAYQSAVLSLYENLVHRKYYVTGGIGSGETSEGFGEDYSLPHHAYCESCSGVGEMLFQHRLQLLTAQAKHADLLEETLYNAVLSDLDLEGQNFTYTNPLATDDERYKWHVCPCCVGNIPRALLMLPTWTYTTGESDLFVNLYVGGTMSVPSVAGAALTVNQETDYPRGGNIKLTLRPDKPAEFTVHLRVPDRSVSDLYHSEPAVGGLVALTINGEAVPLEAEYGYASITRTWSPGDTIEFELPMPVQRVRTIKEVPANRGLVALRRGPLVFSFESVDQDLDASLSPDAELNAAYDPDRLGGVMTVRGAFENGAPFVAIPNYARNNRGGRSTVWINEVGD